MSQLLKKNTWWKAGIRFECQGSGKCCLSRGSYGYVYLTLEDRRRLARHLGLATGQFTRRYCEKEDGYYFVRSRPGETDCQFLNGKSCGVYDARPIQCRTWPFWPENMGAKAWTREVQSFCPGVGKGRLYSAEQIQQLVAEQAASERKL